MLFQKLGRKGKKGGKEETGKYILKIISINYVESVFFENWWELCCTHYAFSVTMRLEYINKFSLKYEDIINTWEICMTWTVCRMWQVSPCVSKGWMCAAECVCVEIWIPVSSTVKVRHTLAYLVFSFLMLYFQLLHELFLLNFQKNLAFVDELVPEWKETILTAGECLKTMVTGFVRQCIIMSSSKHIDLLPWEAKRQKELPSLPRCPQHLGQKPGARKAARVPYLDSRNRIAKPVIAVSVVCISRNSEPAARAGNEAKGLQNGM